MRGLDEDGRIHGAARDVIDGVRPSTGPHFDRLHPVAAGCTSADLAATDDATLTELFRATVAP